MPVAVKLSDSLAEEARTASAGADRSLTGQVEHWARLGKAVEPLFTAPTIAALKKSGGDIGKLDDPAEIQRVHDALARLRMNPPFAETAAFLQAKQGPLYEADPNNPNGVIEVQPDGTRTPGQFVNRSFVPRS
jgi:FMN phosphatase YigB (HAD superfamily)